MLGHARVTREGGTRWWETLPIQVLPSFVGVAHSRRTDHSCCPSLGHGDPEGWDVLPPAHRELSPPLAAQMDPALLVSVPG